MKSKEKIDHRIYDDYYFRDVTGYTIDDHYVFRTAKRLINSTFGKRKGRVLDIGFGRGEMLKYLYDAGWNSMGVDCSESAVKKAKAEIGERKISLLKKEVSEMNFPEDFFDLVLFLNVWEHLNESEINLVLSTVSKILKKDGFFIAQTSPTKYQVKLGHFLMRLLGLTPNSPAWHINEQSYGSVLASLNKHNLTGKVWLERTPKFWSSQIDAKQRMLKFILCLFDKIIDSKIGSFFIDRYPINRFFATDIWIIARNI